MEEKTVAQMRAELRDFYFKNIKPNLTSINKSRRSNLVDVYAILSFLIGFALICMLGNIKILEYDCAIIGLPFIIIGILLLFINNKGKSKRIDFSGEEAVKQKYMPEFLKIFGTQMKWSKDNVYKAINDLNVYRTLNIMNPYFILTFDDTICGTYKDVKFNILEVDTSVTSVKNLVLYLFMSPFLCGCGCFIFCFGFSFVFPLAISLGKLFNNDLFTICMILFYGLGVPLFGLFKLVTKVPFRGVLVEFEMNKNFEGHTFILERAVTSSTIKFDQAKFEEVKLEDAEFCEKYIVYSDNQVEARYVLTTAFMERILKVKKLFHGKKIEFSFFDNQLLILVQTSKDMFETTSLFTTTARYGKMREVVNQFYSIFSIIDLLKLNKKIGM